MCSPWIQYRCKDMMKTMEIMVELQGFLSMLVPCQIPEYQKTPEFEHSMSVS